MDTSAVLAAVFDEPAAAAVRRELGRHERIYASNLLEAETRAAAGREGTPRQQLESTLAQLTWVLPDRSLSVEFDELGPHGDLRGADLYHLACALYLSGKGERLPILTLDRAQARVAAAAGFPVKGTS